MSIMIDSFFTALTPEEKEQLKQKLEGKNQQGAVSDAMQAFLDGKQKRTPKEQAQHAAEKPGISAGMKAFLKNRKQ